MGTAGLDRELESRAGLGDAGAFPRIGAQGPYDVWADDINAFIADFGRNQCSNPCTNENPCSGDFDCDGDVDGKDVNLFIHDMGRGIVNSCPPCNGEDWCTY